MQLLILHRSDPIWIRNIWLRLQCSIFTINIYYIREDGLLNSSGTQKSMIVQDIYATAFSWEQPGKGFPKQHWYVGENFKLMFTLCLDISSVYYTRKIVKYYNTDPTNINIWVSISFLLNLANPFLSTCLHVRTICILFSIFSHCT